MIAVIQCAARKSPDAGHLVTASGKPVVFVANPQAAPSDPLRMYARPDGHSGNGGSWRQVLLRYNEENVGNPLGLLQAYRLYARKEYGRLVDRYGVKQVYILSAGWGLIRADFLTPDYDITYSGSADGYKRRNKDDLYDDLCMLPDDIEDEIVFFGGKDYLQLFCSLTIAVNAKKTVFYNSAQRPHVTGCRLKRFNTKTRTNWHYECANAFIDGAIGPD